MTIYNRGKLSKKDSNGLGLVYRIDFLFSIEETDTIEIYGAY